MTKQEMTINISQVHQEMQNALSKRTDSESVKLIAVSKTFGVDMIEKAYEIGIRDFGENKVQELEEKYNYFSNKAEDIRWHLIGHLQTNKVKKVIGKVYLIHSLDSIKLAEEIDKQSQKAKCITNLLIQVNISSEDTKFGINPSDCIEFIKACSGFKNISLKGLMGIASNTKDTCVIREDFRKLKQIYEECKTLSTSNIDFQYISMGMSNDFETAIEEGSNMIRVGSKIFGKRNYNLI